MLNFDKFINTDVETTPFEMVVFGQGGSVLEVELNEVQALIYQKFRRLFYALGNISSKDSVTYSNGTVTLNGVFILNGYLFECDNISIPASDGDHVYVTINTGVASKDSTIRKKGYVDGDVIDNTILDPRWGAETSRRRIIEFSVSTTDTSGIEIAKIDGGELSLTGVATISNSNSKYTIADIIGLREELDTKANTSSLTSHTSDKSNPHEVTKTQIGLGNVENKSSQTIRSEITSSNVTDALGYKPLNSNLKGSKDGVAELDSNGKVPSSQLPSYVDDVIEGYFSGGKFYKESAHTTEITGESGKIYIDLHTGKTYRWSGSTFGVISETLALGETSSTAYRGDRGKIAYDHSQTAHAPSNAQANVIETIKVNGTAITPSSKSVNITVPTNNNQLTNGAGYITSSETSANALINSLGEGLDTPSDNDYYISQYAGGGTTHRTYYRRPVSALWNYIKSKLATVATSGSYNDLSNKPTIPTVGNGTVTIKQAGASKGTFTMNQSGNTTIELDNTWRGIQDNLTSTSTTDSLSAKQGKILNEKMDNYAKGKGLEFSVVDGILTVTYDDGQ